jgi:oxalate decarboxylase
MNGNTAYRAKRGCQYLPPKKGQNLQAGHVGYVPMSVSHFIENIGAPPSKTLNCLARYMDVSLDQWMALTPHEPVEARLKLNRDMLDGLQKDKRPVV